jgi:hypothetical protein
MTGALPLFRTNHLATSLNTLPWLIDVVDLTRASDAFRAIVGPDCVRLYGCTVILCIFLPTYIYMTYTLLSNLVYLIA